MAITANSAVNNFLLGYGFPIKSGMTEVFYKYDIKPGMTNTMSSSNVLIRDLEKDKSSPQMRNIVGSFELFSNVDLSHTFEITNNRENDSQMAEQLANRSDEELIELIAKRDHPAFSELVRRYTKKFYKIAYRILASKVDSEDMVQDAFLKLWNEPELWERKYETKFTTWFYRVLINQCLDCKRKKSYRNHEQYDDVSTGEYSTSKIMEEKSKSELINNYILELTEQQQLALNLCYYENLTSTEAAEIMDLTPKGVQSLLLRARENLKSKLRVYYEQEAI